MSEYLDTMHDSLRRLRDVVRHLRHLAEAAEVMGNDKLSNELWDDAKEIEDMHNRITDATGKEINDRLADSQASARATLDAVLTGILMGRSESHEPGCDLLAGGTTCSCSPHKEEG